MFPDPKGEVIVCQECRRVHDILRGTKCVCACGTPVQSKEYVEVKQEKVPIMVVYETGKGISCDYPENKTIPLFKLIGFLEVIMIDLKEKGLESLEHTDE